MTGEHRTYRPKRHLRNEIYSLALVMAAPIGVVAVFPYASLSFNPAEAETGARQHTCSFVVLSDEQADSAVQAARSAIKTAREGISALRADLSISAIPRERSGVADVSERHGVAPMTDARYDVLPLPPTLAAPTPVRIAPDDSPTNSPSAFSRDDLLQIWD